MPARSIFVLVIMTITVACAVTALNARAFQSGESRRMLGFVGASGILQPFAEYRERAWTDDGARAFDDPGPPPPPWFTKRGAPPASWRVLVGRGDFHAVKATRPELVDGGCIKMWALASDARGQAWLKPLDQGPSRLALAASGDTVISPFLPASDQTRSELLDMIAPAFDAAESAEVARHPAQGFPAADVRQSKRPTIEAVVRSESAVGGRVLYHVRAVRSYRKPAGSPDAPCDNVAFFSAWIAEEPAQSGRPSRRVIASSALVLMDCERVGARTTVPMGLAVVDGRSFVITAEYGYEDLTLGIFETDGQSLNRVLTTFGGGC